MYRERGVGASKTTEAAGVDRKRIVNEALDKHVERSSPSTSKASAAAIITNTTGSSKPVIVGEESETDTEESNVSGSDGEDTSWISLFCGLRGNEFFCEVDDDYIQDDFNLCGLSSQVPYYDYALDLILDIESSHGDMFTEEQNEYIESAAEMLYGLIHVRYILTTKGMAAMLDKFKSYDFGRCPRVYCCGQPCLPVGQSDIPRSSTVKIYCPKCEDIYYSRSKYQGITVVVLRSDSGNGKNKAGVALGCEKSGKCYPRNVTTVNKGYPRRTATKKCDCPFRLKGEKVAAGDVWQLKVVNGKHDHEVENTTKKEGHSFERNSYMEQPIRTHQYRSVTYKISLNEVVPSFPYSNYD